MSHFPMGSEVKILKVSNPQHRKQIGKLGKIANEQSSYHGHQGKIPVQLGKEVRWYKPDEIEIVQAEQLNKKQSKEQPIESQVEESNRFLIKDIVYAASTAPLDFIKWCQNESVEIILIDDREIQQITLKKVDEFGKIHQRQVSPNWIIRQRNLFDEEKTIGNNRASEDKPIDDPSQICEGKIESSPMKLSSYQQAIIEWVKTGSGHGCCNAVAGSGKTTTLRLAAIALQESGIKPSEIKVCVFGKANSLDLVKKFGNDWKESISTLHSAGWNLVKQHLSIQPSHDVKISANKYKFIAQDLELIGKRGNPNGKLRRDGAIAKDDDFVKLIDLVRLTNQEPLAETVQEICKHFEMPDIYEPSIVANAIAKILAIGESQATKKIGFDFTDQIWLPIKWKLNQQKWFKPYKFVLVDECQDLNAAQLELAIALAGNDGRLLFVGDPKQAIMGFAGADCNSYQNILDRTGATELPLSICYRCPNNHIDLVKRNFPEIPIESSPLAIEGKIETIAESDLWDADKPSRLIEGDMVISRKTAPLVNFCIKLIAKGIAATVKGKAIGEQIKTDLQEIGKMPGFQYSNFNDAVNSYKTAKQQRYEGLDNEEQLCEALKDKLEALTEIYKSQPQATAIAHLEGYIDSLFSDEHSPITLSTCHRAKGLEGSRIFIIKPEDMPMTWRNQQDWQLEQEENLLYVALTRSKSELYIVGNPSWLQSLKDPSQNCEGKTEKLETPQDSQNNEAQVEEPSQICEGCEVAIAELWPPLEANERELPRLAKLLQPRDGLDASAVDRYAAMLEFSEPLPLDAAWLEVEGERRLCILSGYHRRAAAVKAGRETVRCMVHNFSIAEAVQFSNLSNLEHGLQLDKWELEEACKNFLRALPELPFNAELRLIEQINVKTGRKGNAKKEFKQLSNVAIAALFGLAESTIRNYRKDLEREIAIAKFPISSRVIILPATDNSKPRNVWLSMLTESDRMGTVKDFSVRAGIEVIPDNPRLVSLHGYWWCEPENLELTNQPPKTYEPARCKLGDRVRRFPSGELGVVVSVEKSNDNVWHWGAITPKHPLIFWDSQVHGVAPAVELDVIGTVELPSIVTRIKGLKNELASLGEKSGDYERNELLRRINYLLTQITDGEWVTLEWAFELMEPDSDGYVQSWSAERAPINLSYWLQLGAEESAATAYALYNWTFDKQRFSAGLPCLKKGIASGRGGGGGGKNSSDATTVEAELRSTGKRLGLNGGGFQQLPDVDAGTAKHPENPAATTVGTLEQPVNNQQQIEQQQKELARQDAIKALAELKLKGQLLTKQELLDLISWAGAMANQVS